MKDFSSRKGKQKNKFFFLKQGITSNNVVLIIQYSKKIYRYAVSG